MGEANTTKHFQLEDKTRQDKTRQKTWMGEANTTKHFQLKEKTRRDKPRHDPYLYHTQKKRH